MNTVVNHFPIATAKLRYSTADFEKLSPTVAKTKAVFARTLEGINTAGDIGSIARNSLIAARPGVAVLPYLGIGGAVGYIVGGIGSSISSGVALQKAIGDKDAEGCGQGVLGLSGGLSQAGPLGVGLGISWLSLVVPISSAVRAIANVGMIVGAYLMYCIYAANSLYSVQYLGFFRKDLLAILDCREFNDWEKAEQGLLFLLEQAKDCPRLERRIGTSLANSIDSSCISLLDRIRAKNPQALIRATDLLEKANQESFKRLVTNISVVAICILGVVATILTGGSSAVLCAVGAVLWLTVDSSWLNEKIGLLSCKVFLAKGL